MAMIATIVEASATDLVSIIFALAKEFSAFGAQLEDELDMIKTLASLNLLPLLVQELQHEVGYPSSVEELDGSQLFHVGRFFIKLLMTDFCESLGQTPGWAQQHVMTATRASASSHIIVSRLQDSKDHSKWFDYISDLVSAALNIQSKLTSFDTQDLEHVMTFEAVEQRIIIDVAQKIPAIEKRHLAQVNTLISTRLDGYWASKHKHDAIAHKYRKAYAALQAAVDLFDLRRQYTQGFYFKTCEELYNAYLKELYKFDTAYRLYHVAAEQSHLNGFHALTQEIEKCYASWFMGALAQNWSELIERENRLENWSIPGVTNQQKFYEVQVNRLLNEGKKRVVVIISDAFRYEAAQELVQKVNENRYCSASMKTQLGVLPSYTTLGMASLLPHDSLEYNPKTAGVLIDGQSTQGTTDRDKILANHGGMAVAFDIAVSWSITDARENIKNNKVVYIYHDKIDSTGDKASSESGTFDAVETAIEQLAELSRKIVTNWNTSTVLITADHGFLFQQSKLSEGDRTKLLEKPSNFKYKKRYLIGQNLPDSDQVWKGLTKHTAGTACSTEFWIPKGANRFHFVGGARFVHGGAMPQEIAVPIVTVQQLRGAKAQSRTKRNVDVISPRSTLRMVNSIQKFELMQTEAVGENLKPALISVAIYDGEAKVSSEETLTFDSASDSYNDRIKDVRLSLMGSNFDRQKDYFLILKDKELDHEIQRYKVTIDLAIEDDFF
tara:strand:- start:755 stop:2926 length:2172 start_codon:yes stop_codon:yes gene_type:complete